LHNVLQTQIAAYGEGDAESLQMLSLYARNVYESGDWESALALTTCWVDRVESAFGASARQTIDAMNDLAEWCEGLEVPEQALAVRHRLLQAWRSASGPDSNESIDAETSVIAAHIMFGETRAATQEATSFNEDRRQRLGYLHEKALESQATLANLLELQGEWEALVSLRRQALDRVQMESSDSAIIADHQFALADTLASAGKDEEAIIRFSLLLAGQEAAVGLAHPQTVPIRQSLARLCLRSDKPGDAVAHYEALIAAQVDIDGADTPESLESRMELAHLQQELGSLEAKSSFRSNYELAQQLVPDDVRLLAARNDYAGSLYEEDRREEAFELLRWNVVESTRLLGAEHSDTIRIRCSLATALLDDGQAREAGGILEAAVEDHARTGGGLNSVLPMLQTLAEALRDGGRPEHVPAAYRHVLGILSEQLPFPDHLSDLELGRTLPDPFRYEDAIELERLNVAELHSTYGHHHPESRAATDQLLKTLQAVLWALTEK
jgi:tetratricopeptide (TPR) repeat protein